jgi:hypothetical protein
VVASDISAAMLAAAAARPEGPGWAAIQYLECPASAIAADDDSFDVVLCQHRTFLISCYYFVLCPSPQKGRHWRIPVLQPAAAQRAGDLSPRSKARAESVSTATHRAAARRAEPASPRRPPALSRST